MHRESEQYRFARTEGYIITLARLQEQFEDRAVNLTEWRQPSSSNLQKRISALRGAHRKPSARAAAQACGWPQFNFFRSIGRRCGISA